MGTSNSNIRETCTVKWFDNAKGFGFRTDSAGKDVFAHHREIETGDDEFKTLATDQRVTFQPVKTDKGRSASEIKRLDATK